MKYFNLTWAVLACLSFANLLHGQCTLACNDLVNINLPQDGFLIVTEAMVLEGPHPFCPGPKTITVTSPDDINLHDTVTCAQLNFTLMYSVFDQNSGSSCWGSLFVQDFTPPVITCPDLTVDCTDDLSPSSLGYATITDNCDDDPFISFSGQPVIQPCNSPNSAILMRTWQASDASGNHSLPCVQKITIKRPSFADIVFPPNKDGVQSPAIPCGSNPNTSPSVTGVPKIDGKPVTEFCKMVVTYEDLVLGGCANEKTIIRSWTVLNCCTNEVLEHNQIIKVADDVGPVLNCPDSLIFSANGPGCKATFFLPAMTATDNCSAGITWRTLTPWGILQSNGGMAYALTTGTYTVTYEAKDACGNVSTCPMKVIVTDNVAPVAICREYTVTALSSAGTSTVTASQFDNGSYDGCCTNVFFLAKRMDAPANAPFTASVQFTCADAGKNIPVIMQVSDCHGNKNTCMVQVAVQDKTAPTLVCPSTKTIPCSTILPAPITLTGSPTVTEACGLDTLFFSDANNFNMCRVGTITRTFTAIDNFGWTGTCTQTIKLVDNTPAKFFFPQDTIVSCDRPLDSLASGQPTVVSDCEMFGLNVHDEIVPVNCGLKIFRTFSYLEWCTGRDTAYIQTIRVVDDAGPVWADPVGFHDKVFLCGSDVVKPPPPMAIDYCSTDSTYVISDVFTPGGCPNRFTRVLTYEAVDTCGNVSVPYKQTIVVNDTIAPSALPMPSIGPFACYADIPAPNVNDVLGESDNCIGPVTVTWLSDGPNPGCSGVVMRTYRLQDGCGNSSTIAQQINIKDNVPPTANPLPPVSLPCANLIPPPDVNVVIGEADNCGGPVTVAFVNDAGSPGCTGTVTRTYTLTDVCGNSSKLIQLFNINDNVPPNAVWTDTIETAIVGISCEKFVQVVATATDNCPGNPVVITNSFNANGANASGFYPVGETIVTFTFTDGCGNSVQHQTVVIVTESIPPSNFCTPFDVALDSVGFATIDLQTLLLDSIIGGEDLCTTVTYQLEPDTLTCANMGLDTLPGGVVVVVDPTVLPYTLTVTDEFGNSSSCTNAIVLADPFDACGASDDTLVVSGRIFNEYRQPLLGVEVQLFDSNNMSYAYSANLGLFSFQNVPAGMSCELRPVKNTGLLNGVTTYDMVLLSNHILGTQPLDSPYKLIAADVNHSGSISTFDIVALRKAILHMTDSFPNNTSWRFIRADYEFPNPNNPFAEQLPESNQLDDTAHDMPAQNFVAVKIGDLNGSVVLNPFEGEVEERNQDGELTLAVPNWQLKAGREVRIPIACGEDIDLAALQGTFDFDAAKATFVGVLADGLEDLGAESFGEPRNGLLTLGWHDAAGQLLEAGTTLFYLQFMVHQDATVEEILAMNSIITPAIAYKNGGIPLNVRWRIHEAPQMPVDAAPLFSLGQNKP
ncbi:MAG: hypothetical protein IT258_22550, partial [Saprospiraceae bacterium]|nr:hypothetical protein [Saprospiraceae bacterium]